MTQQHLLTQLSAIAEGLSTTLQPFCEVVVHDLKSPDAGIHQIYNNLSHRKVGDAVTALGQARIEDSNFPQVVSNYSNELGDGRQIKSTSIGIKDESGDYVAALCLNVDISVFSTMQNILQQFTALNLGHHPEKIAPLNLEDLKQYIYQFSSRQSSTTISLKVAERKKLLKELQDKGFLEIRFAIDTVANVLGVSRTTIYSYLK